MALKRKDAVLLVVLAVPALAGLVLGLYVVVPLLLYLFGGYSERLTFDSEAWKNDTSTSLISTRMRMADDLLARGELVGKPWSEVEALLGPPDKDPYFKPYGPDGAMIYMLGPSMTDYFWLVIHLADDGTVESATKMED